VTIAWPKPRIVVSACLGFEAVRYDGSLIPDSFVAALRSHAELIPVCPEVAVGLGVPRPPVRLVTAGEGARLVQPASGRDVTQEMRDFTAAFVRGLGPVDGFVLKNRSPSCAPRDARVYPAGTSGPPVGRRPGIFAESIATAFPSVPIEDEGRLTNRQLRANFLVRVFASARLRQVRHLGELMALHTTYKFLLAAHHPGKTRELGRFLAGAHALPIADAIARYRRAFFSVLERPPTTGRFADVAMHLYGFVSAKLSPAERRHFLEAIDAYRRRALPPEALLAVLRSWAARFDDPYLAGQALFEPYPRELETLFDSAR